MTAQPQTVVTTDCPFNTADYAAGLSHLGSVRQHPSTGVTVLTRRTPVGVTHDGVSPWPYLWLDDESEMALRRDFTDLVTLSVVAQPGYVPRYGAGQDLLLKDHYLYDPGLPRPELSPRARARLDRCRELAVVEEVTDPHDRVGIYDHYRNLVRRRGLVGGFFDMPRAHFESVAHSPAGVFVRVRAGEQVGAMACGVRFGDHLQVLHTVPTEEGLTWNASYLLMSGLQDLADRDALRLFFGGLPAQASPGLHTFKRRWSNRTEAVHLLRIVNDPAAYSRLCGGVPTGGFFPAYRYRV